MSNTILVLDDNPLVHSLAAAALAASEVTLLHEFSPTRFIEQAVTTKPEMILLGSLAQDTEFKICNKLLEILPDTVMLLMVDSMGNGTSMQEIESLPVHGVIQKPFESSELQHHVIRHLNIAELTQGGSEFAVTQQQESGFNPLESIRPLDDDVPTLLKGQVGPVGVEVPVVGEAELENDLNLEEAFVPVEESPLAADMPLDGAGAVETDTLEATAEPELFAADMPLDGAGAVETDTLEATAEPELFAADMPLDEAGAVETDTLEATAEPELFAADMPLDEAGAVETDTLEATAEPELFAADMPLDEAGAVETDTLEATAEPELFEESFESFAQEDLEPSPSVFPEGEAPVDTLLADNLTQRADDIEKSPEGAALEAQTILDTPIPVDSVDNPTSIDEEVTSWDNTDTEPVEIDVTQFGGEIDEGGEGGRFHTAGPAFEQEEVSMAALDGAKDESNAHALPATEGFVSDMQSLEDLVETDIASVPMEEIEKIENAINKKETAYDEHFIMASGEIPDFGTEENVVSDVFDHHDLNLTDIEKSTSLVDEAKEVSVEVGDPLVDSSVFVENEGVATPGIQGQDAASKSENVSRVPKTSPQTQSNLAKTSNTLPTEDNGVRAAFVTSVAGAPIPTTQDVAVEPGEDIDLSQYEGDPMEGLEALHLDEIKAEDEESVFHFHDEVETETMAMADKAQNLDIDAIDLESGPGLTESENASDTAWLDSQTNSHVLPLTQEGFVPETDSKPTQDSDSSLPEDISDLSSELVLDPLEDLGDDTQSRVAGSPGGVVNTPKSPSSFDEDLEHLRMAVSGDGERIEDVLESEGVTLSAPPRLALETKESTQFDEDLAESAKIPVLNPVNMNDEVEVAGNDVPGLGLENASADMDDKADGTERGVPDLELPAAEVEDPLIARAYGAETIEGDDVPVFQPQKKPASPDAPLSEKTSSAKVAAVAPALKKEIPEGLLQGDGGISDPDSNKASTILALQNAGLSQSTIDSIKPSIRTELGQVLDEVVSSSVRRAVREEMPRLLQQIKNG